MQRAVLLVVLLVVVVGAAGASATGGRGGADKLTGCRNTSTGVLDQVRGGLLPMGGACGAGEVVVTWAKTGPQGPQGVPGTPGTPGMPGTPGADGVAGWEIVSAASAWDSTSPKGLIITCPAGKKVVGGGGSASYLTLTAIVWSFPGSFGREWSVGAQELSPLPDNWTLYGYAICVTVLP
jgi:hypothetical protein